MTNDFRVGPWLVEPSLNVISRNGTTIHLEPKVMGVLLCLAQQPGEALTKEKLLQAVWPKTFVSDDVLKRCISELRRIFDDSAHEPHVIQTIPKCGYRLVAPVEPVNPPKTFLSQAEQGPVRAPIRRSGSRTLRKRALVVAGAAFLFISFFAFNGRPLQWRLVGTTGVPLIRSIAVLPLQNVSGDSAQEYLSEGMTDALITDLAQIGNLRVVSRTSIMHYKTTDKTLPEIARELHVNGIVEGTVQRSGQRVRITAQLIYAPSDKHIWASSYERDMRDVFALERDIADDIAHQVQERLVKPNAAILARLRVVNARALEAYLQGNYHLGGYGKGGGDDEKRRAAEYFQQAIDADPNFAAAYNGLARAHLFLLFPSKQDAEIAKEAVERAVELDPNLSDAHTSLGLIKFAAWNWSRSEEEFRRAIALNPNSAEAHDKLGVLLDAVGRLDEGWKEQQIAQELDPREDHVSDALMIRGQYDRAIGIIQMMLKRYPNGGYLHWTLFKDYVQTGRFDESIPELEQACILYGFPQIAAELHRAHATSGYRGTMREFAMATEHLMATNQLFFPSNIAEIYATLGEKDRAFHWLERAYEQHDLGMASTDASLEHLNREFRLDALRTDARFKDLVRRVGLPAVQVSRVTERAAQDSNN